MADLFDAISAIPQSDSRTRTFGFLAARAPAPTTPSNSSRPFGKMPLRSFSDEKLDPSLRSLRFSGKEFKMTTKLRTGIHLSLLSLLSAFLLFQVQPLISKFILPWFGGSPGVWTTCMLFFQIVLFGGYAYAHLLTRLPVRKQALLHGCLILAALFCLPISPADSWKPTGEEDPGIRILLLLLATVGLPYFVLSSTSPLVQVWFSRAVPGGRPWRLYALSNIGSLVALLSYPFWIEPRWDVTEQTWMWSGAFVLFVVLSIMGVYWNHHLSSSEGDPREKTTQTMVPVRWWHRVLWVFLPAVASLILLAATNHVCQDVAVIPFLWVVPLSLYLLTFIICFEHERWYVPALWALLGASLLFAAAGYHALPSDYKPKYLGELAICFGATFLGCMVCHGELVRLKPTSDKLTEFYLLMSAGGALGGLFVSLVAPHLFTTYLEWPLGLLIGFLIAGVVLLRFSWSRKRRWIRLLLIFLISTLLVPGVILMKGWGFTVTERLERVRNFYGAISIEQDWDTETSEEYLQLYHGGIVHGRQNMGPENREEPVSYYGRHTAIGRSIEYFKDRPDARIGVVGMGTATVACYGLNGHTLRFYEINPEIVRLARTRFTYLADMEKRGGKVEVAVGDARLALDREPSQGFDVLLLDAFSGDSVPVHLLTKEAFEIYKRHMKPDGIIAVHVTNRYLALAPVIRKIAAELGWKTTRIETDTEGDHDITDYVLVTNNQPFLDANPDESPWEEPSADPPDTPLWTDRRHNLFEILVKE